MRLLSQSDIIKGTRGTYIKDVIIVAKKTDADVNLATEQFFSLNQKFYKNYPCNYFLNKLQEILIKISQPEKFAEQLNGTSVEIGKLKATVDWDSAEEIRQYAKIELSELYYHCLETFLRLFIARAKLTGCDWLELNRLSIKEYHTALKKILMGNFSWLNDSLPEDLTIQYALTGIDYSVKEISPAAINNWKSWIVDCARILNDIKAYNAYKHGLTLRAEETGFSLRAVGETKTYGKHGDTVSYLVKSEEKDRYVWAEKYEFIDIDICATKIFVFSNLLTNMIKVGKYAYLQEEITERWYPNESFTLDIFNNKNPSLEEIFAMTMSFSRELLYYKESD